MPIVKTGLHWSRVISRVASVVIVALLSLTPGASAGTGLYDFSIYPEYSDLSAQAAPAVAATPNDHGQPSEGTAAIGETPAEPQAAAISDDQGWLSEVRLGVLAHNVGPIASKTESGIDINPEILFTSPDMLDAIWAPRPMLGATLNTVGDTSVFYGGLMWTADLWWDTFIDFGFGMAVHDGNAADQADSEGRRALGCRWLFRESLELGYRIDETYSVALYLDHISHGGLCSDRNKGMDNSGVRLHYAF